MTTGSRSIVAIYSIDMNSIEHNPKLLMQMTIGAIVVALLALGVAVAAVAGKGSAAPTVGVQQAPVGPVAPTLTEAAPKTLTTDNPASKFDSYKSLTVSGGVVTRVEASTLVLKNDAGEQSVNATGANVYLKGAAKDPDVYAAEMKKFRDTINKNAVGVQGEFIAPFPFEVSGISLSQIQPNAIVTLYSEGASLKAIYVTQ